jgi:hypothetical protein
MGVPSSEVGYTSATNGRGDHEVHKGHVVALAKICKNVLIPLSDPVEAFTTSIHFTAVHINATGWAVRESNPGGAKILRTRPDWPWFPPSLLYNGCRVFSGVKAAGAWL